MNRTTKPQALCRYLGEDTRDHPLWRRPNVGRWIAFALAPDFSGIVWDARFEKAHRQDLAAETIIENMRVSHPDFGLHGRIDAEEHGATVKWWFQAFPDGRIETHGPNEESHDPDIPFATRDIPSALRDVRNRFSGRFRNLTEKELKRALEDEAHYARKRYGPLAEALKGEIAGLFSRLRRYRGYNGFNGAWIKDAILSRILIIEGKAKEFMPHEMTGGGNAHLVTLVPGEFVPEKEPPRVALLSREEGDDAPCWHVFLNYSFQRMDPRLIERAVPLSPEQAEAIGIAAR